MKIVWLSRHDMTREQERSILEWLPDGERGDAEIVCRSQSWQLSGDEETDNEANAVAWLRLSEEADVVVGVFPPVAVVGLLTARGLADDGDGQFKDWRDPVVLTPVSMVSNVMRAGKWGKDFRFLRWQRI